MLNVPPTREEIEDLIYQNVTWYRYNVVYSQFKSIRTLQGIHTAIEWLIREHEEYLKNNFGIDIEYVHTADGECETDLHRVLIIYKCDSEQLTIMKLSQT